MPLPKRVMKRVWVQMKPNQNMIEVSAHDDRTFTNGEFEMV
jgi:hypothetical protein